MDQAKPEDQPKLEEPSHGGSYSRNADGSLTLIERTETAKMRDKLAERAAAQTDTTPPAADPGAAMSAAPAPDTDAQE